MQNAPRFASLDDMLMWSVESNFLIETKSVSAEGIKLSSSFDRSVPLNRSTRHFRITSLLLFCAFDKYIYIFAFWKIWRRLQSFLNYQIVEICVFVENLNKERKIWQIYSFSKIWSRLYLWKIWIYKNLYEYDM